MVSIRICIDVIDVVSLSFKFVYVIFNTAIIVDAVVVSIGDYIVDGVLVIVFDFTFNVLIGCTMSIDNCNTIGDAACITFRYG